MKRESKYFIVKCNKCESEVKVSPKVYRKKEKVECDSCLQAMFKKFKLS